jgi:hypothetical protein
LSIISAYAPTVAATEDAKDKLYDLLNQIVADILCSNSIFLLGHFNARVGADHNAWPSCISYFAVGNELVKAIDTLSNGKAPGSDGIPPEVVKAGKDSSLLGHLHSLLLQCWFEQQVPQAMRDSKIIALYKNKGDRRGCNNCSGLSLLAIVGKAFARVVLSRLQVLGERVYPELQCGFRPQLSTIDMIFSLRQVQEKCREQNQPLCLAFIDLTKAFDLVSRKGFFARLEKIGCPPTLLVIIKSFHDNMQASVFFDGSLSNANSPSKVG